MVDQLLGGLFGGQTDEDDGRRRDRARDFVNRYETGRPDEGYTDEEAVHNYRNVAGSLSQQEFEEAAATAYMRMSPEQRRELRREMRHRSKGRLDVESDDPREMARATARYQKEDTGGGLASLFGLGGNGEARGHQDGGSLLDNPLAKVALGGIAAMAVKKMMDNR